MAEESTFGLKLEQLAELFSLGLEDGAATDGVCSDQEIAGMLRTQLAAQLPTGSFPSDSILMMMGRLGFDTSALAGKSLGEVLLDSRCGIDLLLAVKDCAKKLSHALISEAKKAVAVTVYYSAVAAALVHHNKKITGHSYEKLDESFSMLASNAWMTPQLSSLFLRARDICRSRQKNE